IPTYKEAGNIAPLVEKLETVLAGMAWEAIFVDDDSPDGTAEAAKSIAMTNPHVRCLRRVNRRGLAGACIEGILSSRGPFVAVMDGDLEHDETLLPGMLATLRRGDADFVVGSRYTPGGNAGSFSKGRGQVSRFSTLLARLFTHARLSDPLS